MLTCAPAAVNVICAGTVFAPFTVVTAGIYPTVLFLNFPSIGSWNPTGLGGENCTLEQPPKGSPFGKYCGKFGSKRFVSIAPTVCRLMFCVYSTPVGKVLGAAVTQEAPSAPQKGM